MFIMSGNFRRLVLHALSCILRFEVMAATKSDKHPKAGKKMTGKASVNGDVSFPYSV